MTVAGQRENTFALLHQIENDGGGVPVADFVGEIRERIQPRRIT